MTLRDVQSARIDPYVGYLLSVFIMFLCCSLAGANVFSVNS